MPVLEEIKRIHPDMTSWRQDIHAHPEMAFEERRTSALVARRLAEWGIDVHTGLAGTGVVGVLEAGDSARSIGLRADMDALPIHEETGLPYASRTAGTMHACGHDGHTAMLLGAARYLAETRRFDGTVYFIFQPAEENEGGGRVMIEDGLFDRFSIDRVFGMHNWPGMPVGSFGLRSGPVTASLDIFEVVVTGQRSHAAMPHQGVDPIVCAASLISAFQTVAARNVDALDGAVVSVTEIHGGDALNVIPDTVTLRGTVRALHPEVQERIATRLTEIVTHVCAAHGCEGSLVYDRRYPAGINAADQVRVAKDAAVTVAGAGRVDTDIQPTMGAEDFAFMLRERPGAYVFVGNGGSAPVHTSRYDFDDDALPYGASYWATLVESELGHEGTLPEKDG